MAALVKVAASCTSVPKQTPQDSNVYLCLFIDGLDEYLGDFAELLDFLEGLSQNPQIKLCVSSRPWNAFHRVYSRMPSLRLEELSKSDILRYTAEKLREAAARAKPVPNAKLLEEITREISDKAEGVFLWVYLVVNSLQRGFLEGDTAAILLRRVKQYPSDLNDFFSAMFFRVDGIYREHTAQCLKLAHDNATYNHSDLELMSFVNFWLISQYENGFDRPDLFTNLADKVCTQTDFETMLAETRSFLNASCKDLLYVEPVKSMSISEPQPIWFRKVYFLHRTVSEYLKTEDMQKIMHQSVPSHFVDGRASRLLATARLKFVPDTSGVELFNFLRFSRLNNGT